LVENLDTPSQSSCVQPIRSQPTQQRVGLWPRIKDQVVQVVLLLLVSGLLTLITYYYWTSGTTGFESFMDSQGFGIRFMMTFVGVVIKTIWGNIDQNLRRLEPYHRLLLGSATPDDSILVPVWMSPFSALLPSLRRGHYLISLVCFVTILSDLLPIALANIPFSPAMTKPAYRGCTYVSITVLAIMVLTLLVLIFRPRQHIRPLPREPTTLASTLLYITDSVSSYDGSTFSDSFDGLALLGTKQRNEHINSLGNRYSLGLAFGDDFRIGEDIKIRGIGED